MRFNFKKIVSVLATTVMLGSTVGIAAAAAYPAPFVTSGAANVAIVIGAKAATIDNIAATDISSNLQLELAKQTASSGSSGSTASGGDSVNLATSAQKIYYNTSINAARTSLTKSELPTLLKDGSLLDDTGTSYSYTQAIDLGVVNVTYANSDGDITDPALILQVGTGAATPLYTYKISFSKAVNVSSSDVQGNDLSIQGKGYTMGSDSTNSSLYLYGAGAAKTLKEGESAAITIGTKSYNIAATSVEQISSVNYVSVSVDGGESKRIKEGSTVKIGEIEVYAKTVHYLAKEAQVSYADLSIGSKRLKLTHGQTVKEGTDETSIQGTNVTLTGRAAGHVISGFQVAVAKQKATLDHISAGQGYIDPVFGGVEFKFNALIPAIDAETRDVIKIDTDNNLNAKISFTSALAGTKGEYTLYYAHDSDSSSSTVTPDLNDSSNKKIHVVENESMALNEYVIIDSGDFGRILKLDDVSCDGTSSSYVQFADAITSETFKVTTGTDCIGTLSIDGQSYYVQNSSAAGSRVMVQYGDGASETAHTAGSAVTVFPRIKLKNGEWLAFARSTDVMNTTPIILPGAETLPTSGTTPTIMGPGSPQNASLKTGNVNWTMSAADFTRFVNITGIDTNSDATVDCNFSVQAGPSVLLIEEHKSGETNGDAICVPLSTVGTTTVEIAIGTPSFTDPKASGLISWTSDSYKSSAVDKYGTYTMRDTTSGTNNAVTIKYPSEQVYADLLVTSVGAEVTTTATGATVAELGSVAVMDSEIDTVKTKNLVVVGGSCINTVAAKLLGSETALCGSAFTASTNVSTGQFLVKVIDSPYTTGKVAMLVAGYEGEDTRKAATYLVANKPSTTVGTVLRKQTATYADVV